MTDKRTKNYPSLTRAECSPNCKVAITVNKIRETFYSDMPTAALKDRARAAMGLRQFCPLKETGGRCQALRYKHASGNHNFATSTHMTTAPPGTHYTDIPLRLDPRARRPHRQPDFFLRLHPRIRLRGPCDPSLRLHPRVRHMADMRIRLRTIPG